MRAFQITVLGINHKVKQAQAETALFAAFRAVARDSAALQAVWAGQVATFELPGEFKVEVTRKTGDEFACRLYRGEDVSPSALAYFDRFDA